MRKDGPIKTPKDLEGKKLALTRIGLVMSILEKMCKDYGCDVSKITLVNMLPQEIVLAFQRGDVDAIQTWEPWAIYATEQGGRVLLSATDSFVAGKEGKKRIDGIYAAVFASDDFVSKNPKTVQAALRATEERREWLEANRDEAAEIVGKDINIPKPVVLDTFSKIHNDVTCRRTGRREFDEKARYLTDLKELKKLTSAKEVFDPAAAQGSLPRVRQGPLSRREAARKECTMSSRLIRYASIGGALLLWFVFGLVNAKLKLINPVMIPTPKDVVLAFWGLRDVIPVRYRDQPAARGGRLRDRRRSRRADRLPDRIEPPRARHHRPARSSCCAPSRRSRSCRSSSSGSASASSPRC